MFRLIALCPVMLVRLFRGQRSLVLENLALPEVAQRHLSLLKNSEQILFAVTNPCCATEQCREEQRR